MEISFHHPQGRQFFFRVLLSCCNEQLSTGRHRYEDDTYRCEYSQQNSFQRHFSRPQSEQLPRPRQDKSRSDGCKKPLAVRFRCGAHTFPDIISANPSAILEHEATTSKISEDQLFYCNQRGIAPEEAVGLIVNGYAHEVLSRLPMEFAVEARKLLQVSLEGSVG